ncbi:unnamed protein product [Rotaria magnacalcarata]|uniref:Uncharacterized protein n=1 Tax=Rotaria magnacalcarata TaxID=392030 RepID=A0A8S3BUK0_9BILA|nr:unnamed protein product [Rotaria magnacalcarata]
MINRNEFDTELSRKMRETKNYWSNGIPGKPRNIFLKINIYEFVLHLYNNVPQTTENFRSLCVGDKYLCYVGSKLTHVFPQYLIRGNDFINIFSLLLLLLFNLIGGNITNFDGSGGER